MWYQFKRYIGFAFCLSVSILVFMVGCAFLERKVIDLQKATKVVGVLTSKDKSGKWFYFNITNSSYGFRVYHISRNYDVIDSNLTFGQPVTVYYSPSFTKQSDESIQAYQVEQNGKVIVDKLLLEGQNIGGGVLGILGGIALVWVSIREFMKRKPTEKSIITR